jgi:ABC-type lipoprotein release transport system permease subunit
VLRQKRRTILTVLTMLGGFALASISIGFSDGSYNQVIEMFTRNQLGHIQIHAPGFLDQPSLYKNIADYLAVGNIVDQNPEVEFWAPRIKSGGLAAVGERSTGVVVLGVDPARENQATRFDKKVVEGGSLSREAQHEVVLGIGLAKLLKAKPGDSLVIISQGADGSIANDLYSIRGLSESGSAMADQVTMYMHLADAQELFVLGDRVHEIAIVISDLDLVPEVTAELRAALADRHVVVEPWQEFAKSFYRAMVLDQRGTWVMLAIIILLVAVGVLNTVLMTVLERRREYGVLRAVGTAPGQIFRLVVLEVVVMAIVAILLGALVSYLANAYLAASGIYMGIDFTYGGVEFSRMYSEVNARTFWIPGMCVLLSALFVSLFPAARAAHTPPARSMRMH